MAALAVEITAKDALAGGKFHFESRSGGAGHEIVIKEATDQSLYLSCSCPGGKFAWAGKTNPGRGCWAMQAVRKALRLQ